MAQFQITVAEAKLLLQKRGYYNLTTRKDGKLWWAKARRLSFCYWIETSGSTKKNAILNLIYHASEG